MGFNNTTNSILLIDEIKLVQEEDNVNFEHIVNLSFNDNQYSLKMLDYMLF